MEWYIFKWQPRNLLARWSWLITGSLVISNFFKTRNFFKNFKSVYYIQRRQIKDRFLPHTEHRRSVPVVLVISFSWSLSKNEEVLFLVSLFVESRESGVDDLVSVRLGLTLFCNWGIPVSSLGTKALSSPISEAKSFKDDVLVERSDSWGVGFLVGGGPIGIKAGGGLGGFLALSDRQSVNLEIPNGSCLISVGLPRVSSGRAPCTADSWALTASSDSWLKIHDLHLILTFPPSPLLKKVSCSLCSLRSFRLFFLAAILSAYNKKIIRMLTAIKKFSINHFNKHGMKTKSVKK